VAFIKISSHFKAGFIKLARFGPRWKTGGILTNPCEYEGKGVIAADNIDPGGMATRVVKLRDGVIVAG
jgi:hypothetical protein